MPDQGPEKVTLWRYLVDRMAERRTGERGPSRWYTEPIPSYEQPGRTIEVREFFGPPEGSVAPILSQEDAETVGAFLGARVMPGREDVVRVRTSFRTALAESGLSEGPRADTPDLDRVNHPRKESDAAPLAESDPAEQRVECPLCQGGGCFDCDNGTVPMERPDPADQEAEGER